MAEVLVGAVMNLLTEKLSDALMNFARSEGIDIQLKDWKKKLLMIQDLLADAGQKEITQKAVKLWLHELQDLAYDIDDVLDDIATEVMKRKLNQESDDVSTSATTRSSKLLKTVQTCFSHFANNLTYGRTMSCKLDEITSKMNDLFKQKNDLGLVEYVKVDTSRSDKTDVRFHQTSLIDGSKVLGRDDDKATLLVKLLGDEETSKQNVSIVSIVGMGGIGKTTLAQVLYNDHKVKDHFELMAWVCVSDDFDVINISKQIYQAVCGENKEFANLDLLHVALKEKLSKKRFLLVLDDVWNEDHKKWEVLKRPLVGAPGSKVIVTTRNTLVASVMNSVQPHNLGVLSDELALFLFAQYALEEQNFDKHPSLKSIAQGIVKKCDGLPLALIALGRVLKTKGNKEVEWKELLNSDIWNSDDKSDILPALKLSYYDLPSHLKQLFAYCSIFPKDYEFGKKKLVLLWMAQGFLSQPKGNNQPMESLGGKYFEELLSRSFFQPLGNDESRYIMHDLMNDLATSVAGEFSFRLDENMDLNCNNEAYEKFRHFSFIGQQRVAEYKKFKELHRARCLRSFLPVSGGWANFDTLDNVTAELLPDLHFLRVLSLTNRSITEVPQSVGSLKHLRYLNFSNTDIKRIPEEVSELYNLQSLLVRRCIKLSSLPVSFVKLINLRHLDMTNTPSLKKLPLGIGGLRNLQTLSKVIIEEDNGFNISELKGLKDLQGALSIEGLEKVIDPTKAMDANLQQKKGLDYLVLVWGDAFRNTTNEDDVIERLRPHSKLKTLSIGGYGGMKFPSWVGDPSFDQLTELSLRDCNNRIELATLGNLTSLQKLEVYNCPNLVSIKGEKEVVNVGSCIMGSLRQVTLCDCHSLETYCCPNSVEKLKVYNCPKLVSIKGEKEVVNVGSSIMGSLRQVTLRYCHSLETCCCPNSVEKLEVYNCPKLVSITGEKEVVNVGSSIMGSLRQVTLRDCHSLETYCCPNSVERLALEDCDSITLLSFSKLQEDLPSSSSSNLKFLWIGNCKNIKSISQEHLQSLTSLEESGYLNVQAWSIHFHHVGCGLLI